MILTPPLMPYHPNVGIQGKLLVPARFQYLDSYLTIFIYLIDLYVYLKMFEIFVHIIFPMVSFR